MVYKLTIHIRVIFLIFMYMVLFAPGSFASPSPETLKQTILVLDRARSNGTIEYQQASVAGELSDTEAKEFRTFLNYLSRRIHLYCTELREVAPAAEMKDLPCYPMLAEQLKEPQQMPPPPTQTSTSAEDINELDGSLHASLGDFDEMLLTEQDKISSEKSARMSATQGGSAGRNQGSLKGGMSTGQEAKQGQATSSEVSSAGAGRTNQKKTTSGKTPPYAQKGMVDDDDIVARQLREAAEKEKDPEIKEKLWEEYRKYKEGVN